MQSRIIEPLGEAWTRAVRLLVSPFSWRRWVLTGFAAWLAMLGHGGISTPQFNWRLPLSNGSGADPALTVPPMPEGYSLLLVLLAAVFILAAAALGILLLWISSHGIFVFLDHLVSGSSDVVRPWRRWRRCARSLFWWRLLVGFLVLLLIAAAAAGTGAAVALQLLTLTPWQLIIGALLLFVVLLAAGVVMTVLHDLVVPVMMRHDLTANAAWRSILPVLRSFPGTIILYLLVRTLLMLLAQFIVLAAGLVGLCLCCVGVLLWVPYVGTVITLPVPVFFRYFSLSFLRRFGPYYDLLGTPPPGRPESGADGGGGPSAAITVEPEESI